jgi:hypothetical protein
MSNFTTALGILVVLGLVAEHYFPYWAEWTGNKLPSPARLVLNYAAGSVVWFGAFTAWLVANDLVKVALVGWGFALLAGFTVVFLYVYDHYISNKRDLRDSVEVSKLLERQRRNEGKRS